MDKESNLNRSFKNDQPPRWIEKNMDKERYMDKTFIV